MTVTMKQTFFLLLICMSCMYSRAQDKTTLGLQYNVALPMGDFKNNYVRDASLRGISLDLMHSVSPKWRVGAGAAYQDFYQKSQRSLYEREDGSLLSAVMTNTVQTTTLMAKAMYLPSPEGRLQPFVSAGAGVNMAQVNQLLGQFDNINDAKFGLAAQAGAGVQYGFGAARRTSLTAGVQYNYLPFNNFNIGSLNNLTFGVGARFTLKQNNNSDRRNDGNDGGGRRPRHYGW
jgi:opacity protein-like surface antigen